jgi:DNA topoisomerase VI subunit B
MRVVQWHASQVFALLLAGTVNSVQTLKDSVKSAITKCCTQLKVKIALMEKVKNQQSRKKELEKYIGGVCGSIFKVVKEVRDSCP